MNVKHSFSTLLNDLPSTIVVADSALRETYSSDRYKEVSHLPDLVVLPETEVQVQTVLRFSHEHHVPVTVRGSGTGTVGAAIPIQGGIVLSMERLTRILEIDIENGVAVVEPGVITGDLKRAAIAKGLFYPPDPASVDLCTIGGNVACNAGGLSGLKYGVTGDYVLGLSGFYADGTPFSYGGKLHKNVAGFDLMSLLIGSEGTLAVITKIIVKLCPYPPVSRSIVSGYVSVEGALEALTEIRRHCMLPYAAEVVVGRCVSELFQLDEDSLKDSIRQYWNGGESPFYLLLAWDGWQDVAVEEDVNRGLSFLQKAAWRGAVLCSEKESEMWQVRRGISDGLRKRYPYKISHDIVVPLSEVPGMMRYLKVLSEASGFSILGYGHLGDGNIHVNFLPQNQLSSSLRVSIENQLFEEVLRCGGSLSGEHGIGLSKKGYMPQMFDEKTLGVMRELKRVFDPHGVLNPGKVF